MHQTSVFYMFLYPGDIWCTRLLSSICFYILETSGAPDFCLLSCSYILETSGATVFCLLSYMFLYPGDIWCTRLLSSIMFLYPRDIWCTRLLSSTCSYIRETSGAPAFCLLSISICFYIYILAPDVSISRDIWYTRLLSSICFYILETSGAPVSIS